jgi:hypothetical protein
MSEQTTKVDQASTRDASILDRHKSPPRLHSHALLGSASEMQRDPLKFLREARQYGDVVRQQRLS